MDQSPTNSPTVESRLGAIESELGLLESRRLQSKALMEGRLDTQMADLNAASENPDGIEILLM